MPQQMEHEPITAVDMFKNRVRFGAIGGLRARPRRSKDNSKKSFSQSTDVSIRKCIPGGYDMESRVKSSYHDSVSDRRGSQKITVGSPARPGSPTPNCLNSPRS
jgi:hypothetical protein